MSRCEKFGYGFMVTQLSSTAAGISGKLSYLMYFYLYSTSNLVCLSTLLLFFNKLLFSALVKAGYLSVIIEELWKNLEFSSDEICFTPSKPHSIQAIDRSVQKVNSLKLLFCFLVGQYNNLLSHFFKTN